MSTAVAATPEIVAFADPIVAAIERIFACLDGQDADGLDWRPPAQAANSLYVLAVHAAEHAGYAELTRDLLKAARSSR